RNQDNGIRMLGLYLHSKLRRETYVAFYHVVHIGHTVAEHQRSFYTHAKRKTRIYIRVNACSAQYLRVYHTAATPFDPLWAAFGIRVPDVKFSRRFREREEVGTQPMAASEPNMEVAKYSNVPRRSAMV